jgi:hypothetical protein
MITAAAAVPVEGLLRGVLDRWHGVSITPAKRLMIEAAAICDLSPGEFCELAESNDQQLGAAHRAMSIAVTSDLDEKVKLLARAWAEAVRDPTQLDPSRVKMESLRPLEAPHIVVLGFL